MSRAAEPAPRRIASPLLRYFLATRPAFLSVSFVGCLVGLAVARGSGVVLDALDAAITVLFALVVHAGVSVVNDYHDAQGGADAADSDRLFPFAGGSRCIQNGGLSERQTARFGRGLLAAAFPAGLWLTWQAGPGVLVIAAAGLFAGWACSTPPLALTRRGLGEGAIATGCIAVVVGTDYVQRGDFSSLPFAAGLSYALLVANLLLIKQFPDHDGDAAVGKRTLVVRLGPQTAKWGYLLAAIVAYGWLVAMVARDLLPQQAAAAAITLVLSFGAARELIAHAGEPAELAKPIRATLAAVILHGLILAAALAFGRWPGVG